MDDVTLALVGIGSLEPSTLLQSSGNIFPDEERRMLGKRGAVGDICLRIIDADGKPVASDVDKRVIGVTLDQLRQHRPLGRGRRRPAQVRRDPRRAARALGQRADHRSRDRRAADRRPPHPHARRGRRRLRPGPPGPPTSTCPSTGVAAFDTSR